MDINLEELNEKWIKKRQECKDGAVNFYKENLDELIKIFSDVLSYDSSTLSEEAKKLILAMLIAGDPFYA